jgi:RHS repeat-associated protein
VAGTCCWGYQFTYDVWGNLLSQAGWSPTYNACTQTNMATVTADGNNHISGLTYDTSGNTQTDGSYTYTWDGESQLKTAGGVTYNYDGDGRRAAKVGSKLYWYGSGGEILSETDASGATLNDYIFFGGKRVADVPASGSALYYAEDTLGSSRVMVQSSGTLCYDGDFTPFGAERAYTNTCAQNYKFEGKERDTETENDDFGAREYSWRFGRWLSSDWSAVPAPVPYANLTNPQTLNLYSMVGDDPESFADLNGHNWNLPGQPGSPNYTVNGVEGASVGFSLLSGANTWEGSSFFFAQANSSSGNNQTGTVNILGQSVPYTIAPMDERKAATALATIKATAATINAAESQLTSGQITAIKAVQAIYVVDSMNNPKAAGGAVTNRAVQMKVQHDLHISVGLGTFIMDGAKLTHGSIGFWASSFVHEGTHIRYGDTGNPFAEGRAYWEQYKASPAFQLSPGETQFIKDNCGPACQ